MKLENIRIAAGPAPVLTGDSDRDLRNVLEYQERLVGALERILDQITTETEGRSNG